MRKVQMIAVPLSVLIEPLRCRIRPAHSASLIWLAMANAVAIALIGSVGIAILIFASLVQAQVPVLNKVQASVPAELSSYKLGVGDVITVQVVGEDELKREKVRLSDAGTLSFPYLGEIRVRGLTVGELEDFITKGLKVRYLLNPQVNVTINEYRHFFVNGLVDKPGGYPFTPGLTVRKAISIAGGFKERASKEKINVIREEDTKGLSQRVSLDAPVRPGDIITVEESFF